MSDVEEMIAVRAAPAQAMGALLTPSRMREWVAPDVTVTAQTATERLLPGDRFRVEGIVGPAFDYQVEAATEREVVLSFEGSWRGEERWSFVADGADTIVRRTYLVQESAGLAGIVWRTFGRAVVMLHFKLELSRFRDLLEREPGVRGEIEPPGQGGGGGGGEGGSAGRTRSANATDSQAGKAPPQRPFEIDEG